MIKMEEKYNWFWGRLLSRRAYIEEAMLPMGTVSVRLQLENQRPILARRNLIQIIRCLQNSWENWRNESQGKLLLDLRLTPSFQCQDTWENATSDHSSLSQKVPDLQECPESAKVHATSFCCQRSNSINFTSQLPSKHHLSSSCQGLMWNSAGRVRYKEVLWRIWKCWWVGNSHMG